MAAAAAAPKSRTRAIAARPAKHAATATYPASPPTISPDANSPALLPASAVGEPYIDQGAYSQQQLCDVLGAYTHPALMSGSASPPTPAAQMIMSSGAFMLAAQPPPLPGGGAASPAWSVSSASLNGDIVSAAPLQPASYYSPAAAAADTCLSSSGLLLACAAHEWLAASCSAAGESSHALMFPGLAQLPASSTVSPALSLVGEAAAVPSPPNIFGASVQAVGSLTTTTTTTSAAVAAANDAAAFDGWLQQYVNADAIESAAAAQAAAAAAAAAATQSACGGGGFDRHPRALSMDSAYLFGGAPIASMCAESLNAADASDMPLDSPLSAHSPLPPAAACSGIDLLNDSEVAAIASAAADALSSDVLASMISSAASYCSPRANAGASASELSMLAALPFTAIATPMANIAPQKTLAMAAAESEPMPPAKKQRRPSPHAHPPLARKTPSRQPAENGRGEPSARNTGSSKGVAPTTVPTAPAASVSHGRPQSAGSSSTSSSPSPLLPPSVRANAAAAMRHMAPLAPRQPSPPSDSASSAAKNGEPAKKAASSVASGARSPSSGTSTPPGLSVLAKIAQKQAPIQVKAEDAQSTATSLGQQTTLRPIAQACSPNSRVHCAQSDRLANGTTSADKSDCSVLLAAATAVAGTGETVAQKRQERLIKNRAAALLSRKRKRDYMTKLESEVEELRESNTSLARRLEEMELRLNALAAERDELRRVNASANAAVSSSSSSSSSSSASAPASGSASKGAKAESSEGAGSGSCAKSSAREAEKPDDSMEVDGDRVSGDSTDDQSAVGLLGAAVGSAKARRLAARTIQPRASLPAGAPKPRQPEGQQQQQQQQQSSSSKQRTTGALLMAVLFSFSLFTLPSLYTSDSQIAAGGSQSAGMLPVRALPPSAAEHRLLISDAIEQQQQQLGSVSEDVPVGGGGESAAVAGSPLLERVRRSISELTQQVDGAQAQPPSSNSSAGGESNGAVARVRPMTMEESAGLHAWIKHGLLAAAAGGGGGTHGNRIGEGDGRAVGAHTERDLLLPALSSASSSLSVVRKPQQLARANRQLDYAMLYCPSMQHVLLGGDVDDVGGGGGIAARYRPSAPRVIHGSDAVVAESPSALDDVDDSVPLADIYSSSRVESHDAGGGSSDLLVPTQAGENSLLLQMPRPKMSLYSPVVARGSGGRLNDGHDGADILAPWEEYARTDPKREEDPAAAAAGGRQKYLRIDVEVVGSRWVTADKFASGLY